MINLKKKPERKLEILFSYMNKKQLDYQYSNDFLIIDTYNDSDKIEKGIHMAIDSIIRWGYSDEYTTCHGCYCILHTSQGSFNAKPKYHHFIENCELLCEECIDIEEYIEDIKNNPKQANVIYSTSQLTEYGFIQLEDDYENGLHYGQNDEPEAIFKKLELIYDEVVFSISDCNMFSTYFSVFVRNLGGDENE